jgi:nicotinamide-nucleotide amidase
MDVELVSVGNELLLGHTVNTNVAEIAQFLSEIGLAISRSVTVRDDHGAIRGAVRDALDRAEVIIITGGLGPTRDDITKVAVAEALDLPLIRDEQYVVELRERFGKIRPGPMPASNLSQADVPKGGERLLNPLGSAPGIWIQMLNAVLIMLPGVPREMRGLMSNEVVPRLRNRADDSVILSRTLKTTGVAESALADVLSGVEERLEPLSLAFLPSVEGVDLRITASHMTKDEAAAKLDEATAILRPMLGSWYYGSEDLAEHLLNVLREKRLTLSCAESCTGGLIGQRLTSIPGSSDVFLGGVVAYSNEVKERVLQVSRSMIEEHGAVSTPVAEAMARGAITCFGTDAAVSVTGIAGPGGGTTEKPVGTVHMAAILRGKAACESRLFPGDRIDIRNRSAQAALDLLRGLLLKD